MFFSSLLKQYDFPLQILSNLTKNPNFERHRDLMEGAKTGEEDELMLELSIGGIFGKPKSSNSKTNRSNDDRIVDINVQSKVSMQVLRPPELRRKREERPKQLVDLGSSGSVTGPFVENKEWLEAQIVQQNDEPACKKERVGSVSTTTVDGGGGGEVVAPVDGDKNRVFLPTASRSFKPYQGNVNLKADDDHGGATDDSRSNSCDSQLDQQPASTSTASVEPFDPSDQPTGSSKQTVSTTKLTIDSNNSNPHESNVSDPGSKPETSSQHQQASLLTRMPCVSTTGNGPNGRTVSGFLYKYTKNEVSIVCVCHGRSFSPAGFVEHAGGVDITNPLKHIKIFPADFAS
ncbi:hypothetical protein E3N88_11262 [Mikania micrantha]|uniref:Ninja-family protein n=1 Tax=Mikania micrantha TaxID=192012 RepID=A0A5N6PCU1_9ASTR|nr:hypothetical protein E3N88_11262 [Mikania micrantha]